MGSGNSRDDLEERLAAFAARLRASQPYRDPRPEERRLAAVALGRLVASRTDPSGLIRLGFSHTDEVDGATGRRYAKYVGGAWGIVLVDLSAPARLVVEVPHPNSDLCTERMGTHLFRLVPGSVLLMAGAHRRAGNGAADVAHNDASLFSALAAEAADRHLPQIQLHGFADHNLPGLDAVVSTGNPTAVPAAVRVADGLRDFGLATCRSWENPRGYLEGASNVQARDASRAGSVFIHLELSWRVRGDGRLRSGAVEAVAAAGIAGEPGRQPSR